MTKPKDLRDEFALAALPEVIRCSIADLNYGRRFFVKDEPVSMDIYIARLCGDIADAMMAEREKSKDFPECSGDPSSCPENEDHGCCGRKV